MSIPARKVFYNKAYLYLALGFLATLIGFFPTYFNQLGETDATHHFHGITGSLWMILLIVQPLLYRSGKMRYHRLLGWAAVLLAPLVVLAGLQMIAFMMQTREPSTLVYKFAFIDVVTLFSFALFAVLGFIYRKKLQYHARFMVCTIFGPLMAAVVRVFFLVLNDWDQAITASSFLFEIILIILILDDRRSGKIRSPYLLCLALFALQHILLNTIGDWPWWQDIADQLAGLPV